MLQTPSTPHDVPSQVAVQISEAIVEPLDESMGSLTYKDNSEGVTVVWHYDRTSDI